MAGGTIGQERETLAVNMQGGLNAYRSLTPFLGRAVSHTPSADQLQALERGWTCFPPLPHQAMYQGERMTLRKVLDLLATAAPGSIKAKATHCREGHQVGVLRNLHILIL